MAQDPETGIDPKATDGDPKVAELELERRRLAKQERERGEEEATGMSDHGNGKRGQPIDDQAPPPISEEDDGQMFVWEQGRKVTLGTLIARGIPVEHAFVFGGKRLKATGGLVGFDEDVLIVCRGKVGKTSLVPTRDDDERVTKVVVETHISTKVVAPADSEHAMDLLAGIFSRRGIRAA